MHRLRTHRAFGEDAAFESVEDVISDVRMLGINGLELPALLARAGSHLPVIFITAHDTPETRELAQRAGAAAYFRKPVDDHALLDALAWALGKGPGNLRS